MVSLLTRSVLGCILPQIFYAHVTDVVKVEGEVKFFLLSERIMILIRVICLNPLLVSKGTALGGSDCSAHMN